MRKWIWLIILTLFPLLAIAGKAILLEVKGPIGPATQDYIERGILEAKNQKASLIILEMDTPGGLDSSMRGIIADIIQSPIPVATYVTPEGARATSAGTFIMYASHFAFMAPHTQIGAASPVSLISDEKTSDKQTTLQKKTMNDSVSYIKSLAAMHNRNAVWAELAVRQGASLTATDAKAQKVIDDIAIDYPDLLKKISEKPIQFGGAKKTLPSNLDIQKIAPDWRYQFLAFITNPNIAYILMLIAAYGLFFELSNPGLILPGVAGLIALFLMLYAFQLMPVNYAGLALIIVGIAFMILEVYVTSFGALGFGGVIAFVIGSILLFDWRDPHFHVDGYLIASMSLLSILFFLMVINLAIRSQKKAVVTGVEGLIGSQGTVISVMNEQIIVRVWGEIWEARSSVMLKKGDKVIVTQINGLKLWVEPIAQLRS